MYMNSSELIEALYSCGWAPQTDPQLTRITSWFNTVKLNTAFKPDWSELEACRESLREHMDIIKKERTMSNYKIGDAFIPSDSPLWGEYDNAAVWCAKRGLTGDIGDMLPIGTSHAVVLEINNDVDAFKQRVNDCAYAIAMNKHNIPV